MHQVGFGDFQANTLGDWILVLFIGAVFTAFIVAVAVAILALYNVLSQRTGMGFRMVERAPRPPTSSGRARGAVAGEAEQVEQQRRDEAGEHREQERWLDEAHGNDEPPVLIARARTVAMRHLRRHPLFVGATAALAALEALVVVTIGPAGAVPLAPQISAPAPYGVFHDLRWLLVYHPSWARARPRRDPARRCPSRARHDAGSGGVAIGAPASAGTRPARGTRCASPRSRASRSSCSRCCPSRWR